MVQLMQSSIDALIMHIQESHHVGSLLCRAGVGCTRVHTCLASCVIRILASIMLRKAVLYSMHVDHQIVELILDHLAAGASRQQGTLVNAAADCHEGSWLPE